MNSLYISAAHKSSGKTILSVGLSRIFSKLNYKVQAYKKGPDYIDPSWLSLASGSPCYNLDFNTQKNSEIVGLYEETHLDFNIIEGNKGLYDGLNLDGSDSNAALAKLLNTEVLLIINSEGITRGIAPLLDGYINFDKKCKISGVILNNVASSRHEEKLVSSIRKYTDLEIYGAIPKNENFIQERHLGLVPSNENKLAMARVDFIAKAIKSSVDIKKIERNFYKSNSADHEILDEIRLYKKEVKKIMRIGILHDQSFGFYYSDDLEKFSQYGAELIYINSIQDKRLPKKLDGLFIGGGFPEIVASKLEKNIQLKLDIKDFIMNNNPCYVECGGLMYLCNKLIYNKKKYNMVGVIPGTCEIQNSPVGRGYVKIQFKKNNLWNVDCKKIIKCHEFHYAKLKNNTSISNNCFSNVLRGYGINGQADSYQYKNLLANFSHLRHTESFPWVKYFIDFVKRQKSDKDNR